MCFLIIQLTLFVLNHFFCQFILYYANCCRKIKMPHIHPILSFLQCSVPCFLVLFHKNLEASCLFFLLYPAFPDKFIWAFFFFFFFAVTSQTNSWEVNFKNKHIKTNYVTITLFCRQKGDLQEQYPLQAAICFFYLSGKTLKLAQCLPVPITG